jgi:hypothetical protein
MQASGHVSLLHSRSPAPHTAPKHAQAPKVPTSVSHHVPLGSHANAHTGRKRPCALSREPCSRREPDVLLSPARRRASHAISQQLRNALTQSPNKQSDHSRTIASPPTAQLRSRTEPAGVTSLHLRGLGAHTHVPHGAARTRTPPVPALGSGFPRWEDHPRDYRLCPPAKLCVKHLTGSTLDASPSACCAQEHAARPRHTFGSPSSRWEAPWPCTALHTSEACA